MRYIFIDEAGTSAPEPVTVVVGIIAHADEHVMAAEAAVEEALGAVPPAYLSNFVFHALEIFGNDNIRDGWSLTDRLHLLKTMMSIPRRLGMAIALSAQWRRQKENAIYEDLSPEQGDHLLAFSQCLCIADRNIRDHAGPREVATLVVENVKDMQQFLRVVPGALRDNPIVLGPEHLREITSDLEAGHTSQRGDMRVTRIRRAVHFVEKADDPLVQLADACAFGFRRYFAGQNFGTEFARSILGDENLLRDFSAPGGAECYWPRHLADPSKR